MAVREKSLTLTGCDFTGCQCPKAGGGAVCVAYSAYRTPEMTVIGCSFDGCTAQGTGVFHIAEMGVEKLVLDDCHFISCESVDSAAVLDTTITTVDVTCVMCQFVGCTGKDLNAVLRIVNCTSLTFLHNNFSLSLGLDKKRAIFIDMPGTLEIIGCSFSNNGGKLSKISVRERAGFLVMERRLEKVLIQDCPFQDIATEVDGGGIGLSMEMRKTGAYLTIIGCNFTRLSARDGGAVSVGYDYMNMPVYTTALVMKDCIVESCYADNGPGGAVCVDVTTWYSQITDCTFINNSAQQLGQSLHLRTSRNVIAFSKYWHIGRSNILNCTFQGHDSGPLIATSMYEDPTQELECGLSVLSCIFENNHLGASTFGLVYSMTKNMSLQSCIFDDNTGDMGLIVIGPHCDTLEVVGGAFDKCKTGSTGIIVANDTITGVSIMCFVVNFSDCTSDTSACLFSSADATVIVVLTGCFFEKCQGSAGTGIVAGEFGECAMKSCTFTDIDGTCFNIASASSSFNVVNIKATRRSNVPVAAIRAKTESHLDDFTITTTVEGSALPPSSGAALELVCESGAKVAMLKCCFNSSKEAHTNDATGLYLKLDNEGTVTLAEMCFDTEKSSALQVSGNGQLIYEGDADSFFVDCFCGAQTPTPITPIVPTTIPIPPPPSESGTGKKTNAGMIAGVVVAVLVVIAIVVVLLFFFVFRRRRAPSSSSEDQRYDDEPEVTITTINDTNSDTWGTVTEDNPAFATQSDEAADSPFGNAIEEQY